MGGLRAEMFTFNVTNRCDTCVDQPAGKTSSGLVLPKVNLILGPWFQTEFFANYGEGYHSNDARSAVAPGGVPLARAKTYEVGLRSQPWGPDGLMLTASLWAIDLQSELVFVGDEGTTEARGPTRRRGVEVAATGPSMGAAVRERQCRLDKRQVRQRRRDSVGARAHRLRRVDLAVARRLAFAAPGHVYGRSSFDRRPERQISLMARLRPH